MRETVLVGVCGGSGSGKSTFTHHLADRLGRHRVGVLPLDSYYRDLGHLSFEERLAVNFDHPDSIDHELFEAHLDRVADSVGVEMPVYDFSCHSRAAGSTRLDPRPIVLVEGILLLAFPGVRDRLHRTVFLDVPAAVRLERRVGRDVRERGRIESEVRQVFAEVVQPMHERFVQPGAGYADHVIGFEDDPRSIVDALLRDIDDPVLAPV
ncbi:MAG: uridine kinase [Actinomycetota bacterium]